MKMKLLEKDVETLLGYETTPERYAAAYKYAKHKLDWQAKRNTKTYDSHYLAIVISETYEQQARTNYINTETLRRMEA